MARARRTPLAGPHRTPSSRPPRTLLRYTAALVPITLAGGLLGSGAMLLVGSRSARPAVFVGIGVLVGAMTAAGLTEVVRRRRRLGRRLPWFRVGATTTAAALLTAGCLTPLSDPPPEADPLDLQYWELSTGSRLAYRSVVSRAAVRRPWPVVVLHGGPGIPDLAHDRDFWGRLAADGFDVDVYAQVASGRSTRLADPTGYSLDRDVADLEQIRRTLAVDQMVLVGHSYGGTLAAATWPPTPITSLGWC